MKRRNFIAQGCTALGLSLMPEVMRRRTYSRPVPTPAGIFGIQLYMVKEAMAADPLGTLKALAAMGYRQIESFEGDKGMFWGFGPLGFRQRVEDLGMHFVSGHYSDDGIESHFQRTLEAGTKAGLRYLITPFVQHQESVDDFKRNAEQFNRYGALCNAQGLRFAFHGENLAYATLPGTTERGQDILLRLTDPKLVDFQMDVYYPLMAGIDTTKYLLEHSGRFRLCHLRDLLRVPLALDDKDESACDLGTGKVDFPAFFKTATATGMKYFFVEQSRFHKITPLDSAKVNAQFMLGAGFTKG